MGNSSIVISAERILTSCPVVIIGIASINISFMGCSGIVCSLLPNLVISVCCAFDGICCPVNLFCCISPSYTSQDSFISADVVGVLSSCISNTYGISVTEVSSRVSCIEVSCEPCSCFSANFSGVDSGISSTLLFFIFKGTP